MQTGLSHRERALMLAIARAAMPAGRVFDAPDAEMVARVEAYLVEGGAAGVAGVRALLNLLDAACRVRHLRGFQALSVERQQRFLRRQLDLPWPLRLGARGLLLMLKIGHYDDEAKFEALGMRYRSEAAAESRERWMDKATDATELPEGTTELEADAVVVGTGAGGAAIAFELARRGLAVVLLEEGRHFTRADFTGRPIEMQRMMYRSRGLLAALSNTNLFCPAGATVGGTTTINSGTCRRPPDRWLRRWQTEHGLLDFGPEQMAPYYERVETLLPVETAKDEHLGGCARVVARGCDALGWAHGPLPRNAPDCDGQGVCSLGCPTDAKRSTNVSYVPMALKSNAFLFHGLRVDRVLTEGGRAAGVSGFAVAATGRRITVRARVTVLACGTYFTPLVLQRNGLCGRSGQVGRNLTVHPASFVGAMFDEVIDGWNAIPQGYALTEFDDDDLVSEGGFVPMDMGTILFEHVGPELTDLMERYRHYAMFGFMVAETSRGTVRPLGKHYTPLIRYHLDRRDRALMKRGYEVLAEVFLAAGARRVLLGLHGQNELRDRADLQRLREARIRASDIDATGFHPLGTCRMGVSPLSSVVGPRLQAWDVEDLYIADGSVVPTPLAANPQITIMALATRAAEGIAEKLG